MSTKNICLALVAVALTVGVGAVSQAHRAAVSEAAVSAPTTCSTDYDTVTDANGGPISVVTLTCSRSAQRLASGAAL